MRNLIPIRYPGSDVLIAKLRGAVSVESRGILMMGALRVQSVSAARAALPLPKTRARGSKKQQPPSPQVESKYPASAR